MIAPGALAGLRVLDMTRVIAGPYAGQILGDLGADVIKLERPGEGDDVRGVGPPWMKDRAGHDVLGDSTYFQAVNRNKRGVAVDFSQPEGATLVSRLAAKADVLLENYRTGTLAKYDLGYPHLSALNPRLIYCSITGFGQTGPYAQRSGYDYLAQAMAGVLSVTGHRDGEPGAGPMRVGIPVADFSAGLFSTVAVLAALNHRQNTGRGQHIDVSLFDAQLAAMLNTFSAWFNSGVALGRTGNDHPSSAPYGIFPVDDGFLLIATFNDREFVRLANSVGHPEWLDDPRFNSMPARNAHREALRAQLTAALRGRNKAEWTRILNEATVSCGPINEMKDLEQDPQVLARGLVVEQAHGTNGRVRTVASPMRFSASPVSYRSAPPRIGEHTAEVLRDWLGLNDAEIAALAARQAIGA